MYCSVGLLAKQMLKVFPNVCVLRVRMPISDDLSPRNFVTKIVKYEKVNTLVLSSTSFVVIVFGGSRGVPWWCSVVRGGVVAFWISVRKTPENGIVVFPLSLDASEFSFLDARVLVVGHGGQVSPPPSRFFQVVWPSVLLFACSCRCMEAEPVLFVAPWLALALAFGSGGEHPQLHDGADGPPARLPRHGGQEVGGE